MVSCVFFGIVNQLRLTKIVTDKAKFVPFLFAKIKIQIPGVSKKKLVEKKDKKNTVFLNQSVGNLKKDDGQSCLFGKKQKLKSLGSSLT